MSEQTIVKKESGFSGKAKAFFRSETFKALLPLLGFIVIVLVFNALTEGSLLKPKKLRLLLSQVYAPMIAATGVFFIMTINFVRRDFINMDFLSLNS